MNRRRDACRGPVIVAFGMIRLLILCLCTAPSKTGLSKVYKLPIMFSLWALDEAPVVNTEPLRVIRIPDFPILCTSWNPSLQQLVCGGGAGSRKGSFKKSFVGTPVYVLGDVL